ncbi:MAG: lipopolysaccharide biosynthesis protein [Duncaniella sp.]|nr:lipopolysaccharide biosynthesis protein [Duncaniella sp.]
MPSSDNKRIAKNTLFLYFRMLLIMAVTLYTSRVVLNQLGVVDYGILNVVGSIVSMLAFLNGSMSLAAQRFFAVDIGRKDFIHLRETFSMVINIHAFIAIITLILAETIGLWLVDRYLNIPDGSLGAAKIVYHFAIIQTVIGILTVPLSSLVTAFENMKIYAYLSIVEAGFKLLVAFLLSWILYNKLILYAALGTGVCLTIFLIWIIYCVYKYPNCRYSFIWDSYMFKELFSFSGWQTLGTLTWLLRTQGINFIINIFFGPVLNTARGIAVQVNAAIMQVVTNFQMASNPQITKYFAKGEKEAMYTLILRSSKFSYLLMFIIALPVTFKAEQILYLWLGQVPDYSVMFLRLMIVCTLSELLSGTMVYGALASGKVKEYQSWICSILILEVIFVYLAYKVGFPPQSAFYIEIALYLVALIARLFIVHKLIGLPISSYSHQVLFREFSVTLSSVILIYFIELLFKNDQITSLICFIILAWLLCSTISYFLGLSLNERKWINSKVYSLIINKIK